MIITNETLAKRLPRVSGDRPYRAACTDDDEESPPRERGSTSFRTSARVTLRVSPA